MQLTELFSQPSAPMYPFRYQGDLHWLEALPQDGGRVVLMRQTAAARQCLTPPDFNIRTAVHEYGGRCFCVLGEHIIFNNFHDGRIYRQRLCAASTPIAVTESPPAQASRCFADLLPLARHNAVLAVMETSQDGAQRDSLALIQLADETKPAPAPVAPRILVEGGDFYASPVASLDHRQLAWLEWDHPYMPWDQSRLVTAELSGGADAGELQIRKRQVVVARANQAVCQPGFLADHTLLFVSDGGDNNFWNFFSYKNQQIKQITHGEYEYGEAHWIFGKRRWQQISEQHIIAVASRHQGDTLRAIACSSAAVAPTSTSACAPPAELHEPEEFAVCADLWADTATHELLFVASYAERSAQIRALHLDCVPTLAAPKPNPTPQTDDIAAHGYSQPQPIAYPTRDRRQAYAYFYPPFNRRYCAPADAKPPLMVVVHGGPTSRATPEMNPLKQFFTSLGYAVLDVNHRGSTGYGRAYRQRLLGRWGEIDADDIADGVRHVVAAGLVNPELVFIRGGSAGGYAVLRALTRCARMFSGGACYYGIGNLLTLAKITHKFEGHYTDRLIGEKFAAESARLPASRFVQRSPIFQLDRLSSPLILFQGLQDKVVPAAVSREVAELLSKKGIPHEYIEYEHEGHGFRRLSTRVDSLTRETAFFAAIIRAKSAPAANTGSPHSDGARA